MLKQSSFVFAALGTFVTTLLTCSDLKASEPHALELQTQRVVVFKDGYFLMIKRGEAVSDANGQVYTDDVPDAAALGTFWATQEGGTLQSMVAGWTETKNKEEVEATCRNTLEVLIANEGQTATIVNNDNQTLTGTILKVLVEKLDSAVDRAALPPTFQSRLMPIKASSSAQLVPGHKPSSTFSSSISDYQGAQFVLKTEEGDLLLHVGQIKTLSVKSLKSTINRTVSTVKKTKRLTFNTDKPNQKQVINLFYFRPGIRWIPTYRVVLDPNATPKKATIAMQAEILNEAEDLKNVPIDIVVGVPNFRFKETISPFTLEVAMQNALREAAPQLMGQSSNALVNSSYMSRSGEFRHHAATQNGITEGAAQLELSKDLSASGSQELFVYKLKKTTLALGERAAIPIFESTCPYRDVYTWDVVVSRQDIEVAPSGAGLKSPLSLSNNQVWRQIELTNTTNLPWTTGAAMVMEGQQPLAQELLTYTSPKNPCRLPMTIAIEVKSAFDEKETARKLDALVWQSNRYAKIDKQSKLHICNNKKSEIEIEVSLRLGGRAEEASLDGEIILEPFRQEDWVRYSGHPAVNNSSYVKWKFNLKPGEVIEPTVDYHYYAYH